MMTKKKFRVQIAANNYKPTHPEHFRVEHSTDGNSTSRLVACKDYPSGSFIIKLDKENTRTSYTSCVYYHSNGRVVSRWT
jgi:hypothetical protein